MRKPCREKRDTKKAEAWSKKEDDEMLVDCVGIHGKGCRRSPPQDNGLRLRCGKSCRLRCRKNLRPDLKRINFGEDEDDLIIKLHALLGNRWSLIAGRLPGRSDNEVENYWNSHLKSKLISMGIDPNNHRINQTLQARSENQILDVSNSDDINSTCATSAVISKALKFDDQNKIHDHLSNGKGKIEVSGTHYDKKVIALPDLNLELAMINSNSHAAASTSVVGTAQEN